MMKHRTRRAHGGWRPGCEGLEGRLLLSFDPMLGLLPPASPPFGLAPFDPPPPPGDFPAPGAMLTILGTEPADGAILRQPGGSLAVRFDRALDPFSVYRDLRLDRVGSNGRVVPVFDQSTAPVSQVDPQDPTRLLLEIGRPLEPGRYRLVLSGDSFLSGEFGECLPDPGIDKVLAEFTVATPGVTRADAIDLGVLGSEIRDVAGTLDLAVDPAAVALYRITLSPAQRLWRLGLEVDAERIGSLLDPALTLFDAQGRPIATADVGRFDRPNDPYLFAGLEPGTYYIGVSGHGNLAGQPGGYDPITGDPGAVVVAQPGGPFMLRLVADPAGPPETLIGFRLDHADPIDPAPTGFHLQFSGALRLGDTPAQVVAALATAVEVVDDSGRAWPIAGVGYDESRAILAFEFLTRLPAGCYRVRMPEEGGLRDLAGRSPVAPGAEAPGVLASFRVAAARPRPDALDLGALFRRDVPDGLTLSATLAPSEARTLRFVALHDDSLRLGASLRGGRVALELVEVRTGATRVLDLDPAEGEWAGLESLAAGEYRLRIRATGDAAVRVEVTLRFFGRSYESLLLNGIGQGPALGLRLVAPTASSLAVEPPPDPPAPPPPSGWLATEPSAQAAPTGPATPPTGPADARPAPPGAPAPAVTSLATMGGPSALLALGTGPVGLPTPGTGQGATAGPGVAPALASDVAPASAFGDPGPALPPPAGAGAVGTGDGGLPTDGALADRADVPGLPIVSPPRTPAVAGLGGMVEQLGRFLEGLLADLLPDRAATQPLDGVLGAATVAAGVVDPATAEAVDAAAPDLPAAAEGEAEEETARATAEIPVALGLTAALVLQVRETLARWLRRLCPERWRRHRPNRVASPGGQPRPVAGSRRAGDLVGRDGHAGVARFRPFSQSAGQGRRRIRSSP